MDISSPIPIPNSPLTPVFGDNVQDLLSTGALNVNPTGIIVVNSNADTVDDPSSGVITLRDAINQANSDAGFDLIVFDRSLFSTAQTIILSGTELDITHNLSIIAPRDTLTGEDLVTVSGNNASRVFEIETGATVTVSGLIEADGSVTDENGGGIMNSGLITDLNSGGIKNSGTLTLDSSIVRNNSIKQNGKYPTGAGAGIYNSGTLTASNNTISGNSSVVYGAGIYNSGTLTVSNNTISGNATAYDGGGGGIYNSGTMTVSNSTISGNSADDGGGIYNSGNSTVSNNTISENSASYSGGGIYNNYNGTITVSNSTISSNSAVTGSGGGIDNSGTSMVSNSTISGNSAPFGGGIYNSGTSPSIVSNSTISGNSADNNGGGIYNVFSGMLTVSNSTINDNSANKNGASRQGEGGGIYNSGTVEVSYSTINDNSAFQNAGGIYSDRTVKVSNSTLSGNSTNGVGGGIYNNLLGNLTLVFSTLTLNSAANASGVFNATANYVLDKSTVSARNTIIAGNILNENGINPDVSGIFNSSGYNLIGDSTGSTGFDATGDIVGTSDNPIDPRLAPLDFYGGSTQTLALLPDSPAIDAGDPTVLDTDPTTDQRGLPRVSNVGSDIGAYEVQV